MDSPASSLKMEMTTTWIFFVLNHFRTVVRFIKFLLGGVSVSITSRTLKMSNSEFFMIASKANSLFHKTFLSNNSNEKNTVALIEIRTPDLLV